MRPAVAIFLTLAAAHCTANPTPPTETRISEDKLYVIYDYTRPPAAVEITELPGTAVVLWNGSTLATIRDSRDPHTRIPPAIVELPDAEPGRLELRLSHVPSPRHAGVILRTGSAAELRQQHANHRLVDGVILGILLLAGTFNMLLLSANPRNTSHLWFGVLTLLAAGMHARRQHLLEAFVTPHLGVAPEQLAQWFFALEIWMIAVALPVLLCSFLYVLFPGLGADPGPRNKIGTPYTRRMRIILGLVRGCAVVLSVIIFGTPPGAYAPYLNIIFYGYSTPVMILAAVPVLLALHRKYRVSLLAAVGGGGTAIALIADYGLILDGRSPLYASAGALVLVFSSMALMRPQRYHMHRELKTSRSTLRDSNKKLMLADRQKNRYIVGSAREMIAPLQDMLAHCLDIVGDPAYRLHSTQLSVLSHMMDTAKRMLRRFQRIQLHFGGDGADRPANFQTVDAVFFLNSQAIVFEERHPELNLRVRVLDDPGRLHADPELLEICLAELVDNVAAHGRAGTVTLEAGRRGNGRAYLCVHERESRLNVDEAAELIEEFRTGARADSERIGLGFSLVRRIAEIHGSDFTIRRDENEDGLRYEITVPLVPAASTDQPPTDVSSLRHIQFLGEIGFDRQARQEAKALLRREPAMRAMVDAALKNDARPRSKS